MNKKHWVSALAMGLCATVSYGETLQERVSALESGIIGDTSYSVGGYIKLDTQFTQTNRDGRVNSDVFIPSLTPVQRINSSTFPEKHANESRLSFRTSTPTELGKVTTLLEFDFLGSAQGNERITNSYSLRLRHAAATFNGLTVGQTWSTFFDPASLPDLLDLVGPVGITFVRQPLIRYQTGDWELALENPQSTLYEDGANGFTEFDDNSVPDAIVRYRVPLDSGSLSLAAMGREVAYRDDNNSNSRESRFGYGVTASARFPVGDSGHDLRAQVTGGNAIGRYMTLNGFSEGQIESDGDIELIDQFGGHVSYRHLWSPQWRSNLSLSHAEADNPDSVSGGVARRYSSGHINLIHSPLPNIDLGTELIYGKRENENRDSGELYRLQFSAKVAF
ncbi:MAG: DcaP family trimeric outer membrane transporter [Oleiphilaceae bacterium]|nr:DcaP family trimeric outer membrane transporter [Oleiphilaceae bacterium]